MIRRIGNREWEEIKKGRRKGYKEILELGDNGQKTTDITKKYLNTIWKKTKLTNKGQKINQKINKVTRIPRQKIKRTIIITRKIKG